MAPAIQTRDRLAPTVERAVRAMLDRAFEGDFSDEDWQHALGGMHALAVVAGDDVGAPAIVAHASVVPRVLWVGDEQISAGYVEAVAVEPAFQGRGLGTEVMRALAPACDAYRLCALSTGEHDFFGRLGWRPWRGPTWVRTPEGPVRTPDEDDGIMVRASVPVDVTAPLACETRTGDDW